MLSINNFYKLHIIMIETINTSAEIKELYNLLSSSNHWAIREKMDVYRIDENGAMHIFYEKQREFADAEGRYLSIYVKFKSGHFYVSPHDQVCLSRGNDNASLYEEDKCSIYAFINDYLPSHPEATDVVEELICNIDGIEFTITPDYSDLMYLDILTKSKVQERPIILGFPDASLNISY